MSDYLEIALILDRKRYKLFYNASVVLLIILTVFFIMIFTCKYQSYYITLGTMIDGKLELLVDIQDIEYIKNNDRVLIEDTLYKYKIDLIDDRLYCDDNYHNYKSIYLAVDNLESMNNYVYEIKIPKENKTLASYMKDFVKEV